MKSSKWLITFLLILLLVLTACKINEDVGTGEVADTPKEEAALPEDTETKKDEPDQKSEQVVDEPADEPAGDPAVDKTLLDTEAMAAKLGAYLLRPEDMPHSYYIPEGGEQHYSTIRLIQEMGEIEAKTYVKETGRIDGWWLSLQRTSKADFAPGAFESSIELYQSSDGAQNGMTPAYYSMHKDESRDYSRVDGGCDLGDSCEFYYSEKEEPTTELVTAQYNVAFTYRNAFVWVMARGLSIDMDADYVLNAARDVFAKLENAPTR